MKIWRNKTISEISSATNFTQVIFVNYYGNQWVAFYFFHTWNLKILVVILKERDKNVVFFLVLFVRFLNRIWMYSQFTSKLYIFVAELTFIPVRKGPVWESTIHIIDWVLWIRGPVCDSEIVRGFIFVVKNGVTANCIHKSLKSIRYAQM